jgi:hypothetical protein
MGERRLQGSTQCSHGWWGWHCIRDAEGSCPFPGYADEPCRCRESEYLELRERQDGLWEVVEGGE